MIRKRVTGLGAAVFLVFAAAVAESQQEQESRLSEREEVTAVDLRIELTRDGTTVVEPPQDLRPDEFIVRRDGETLAVVGVASGERLEPWHLTIYFDHLLSRRASLRWSASVLADLATSLVDLGYVEIVAADPEPRRLLAPTRDADIVDQTLSGIFLEGEADNALLAQREEFLLQRRDEPDLAAATVVRQLLEAEERLVVERQDALLHALVENPPSVARRAVLFVGDGFETAPESFYARFADLSEGEPARLEKQTDEWIGTVAGYGWSVIAVMIPERDATEAYGAVPGGTERTWGFLLPGVTRRLEGSLDPQRAAAQHELGQTLAEQDALEDAAEALTEALRFYHGHQKYALQRAAVLTDLGEVLLKLDRIDEAREALREAVRLDPDRKAGYPFVDARLEGAEDVMQRLAAASAGQVARDAERLSEILSSMQRSARLTFQFRGPADGRTHPVAVDLSGRDLEVRAPLWVRFGTPQATSALRARRLLRGDLEEGEMALTCRFVETDSDYAKRTGTVEIRLVGAEDLESLAGETVRLTLGLASEDGGFEIRQRSVTLEGETYAWPVEIGKDVVWMSVVLDDPGFVRWGGATSEL